MKRLVRNHNIFRFNASLQKSLEELAKSTPDTSTERKYLEEQIKEMKAELKLKNDKIDKLEKIVYKKKEAVATQVRLREDFLINASYHLSADPENTASCRKIGRAKGESRQEPPQHQHQSRVHVTR